MGRVAAPFEQVVQAGSRLAQHSGREQHVARTCAAAPLDAAVGSTADGRHVDSDAPFGGGRITPDECDAELLRERAVSLHELFGPRPGGIGRQRDGEERRHGAAPHGGYVAQIDGERLGAQLAG